MIALDAKLIPHFVARHTYQTPAGQIGFDGALVQSILEQSGRFVGAPQFAYTGDWSRVRGRFEKRTSQKGNEFIVPTWGPKEAEGLGIIVRWRVVGEESPRTWPGEEDPFLLTQCFPLNSPLWATDPKTQIAYLAIRRFANIAAPGILGAAIPEPSELIAASDQAIDVTPEPRREDFVQTEPQQEFRNYYDVTDLDGEVHVFSDPHKAAAALRVVISEASRRGVEVLDEAWGNNDALIKNLDPRLRSELGDEYTELRERVIESRKRNEHEQQRRNFDAPSNQPNPERGEASDPERKPGDAVAEAVGIATASTPDGSEGEAETRQTAAAEPQQRGPVAEPTGKPAETLREPGGSPGPAEQSLQPGARPAPPAAERPEPLESPSSDARGDAAPSARDRQSQYIAPPAKRGSDEPDFTKWAGALFLPRVRRQTKSEDLAFLLGDNEVNLEWCHRGGLGRGDLDELDRTIKEQWTRVE
jgi:hypothetical protein